MAELVDAADSKSVFERSGSSSLPRGTIILLVFQGLREGVERNFYPFFYPKNLPLPAHFLAKAPPTAVRLAMHARERMTRESPSTPFPRCDVAHFLYALPAF